MKTITSLLTIIWSSSCFSASFIFGRKSVTRSRTAGNISLSSGMPSSGIYSNKPETSSHRAASVLRQGDRMGRKPHELANRSACLNGTLLSHLCSLMALQCMAFWRVVQHRQYGDASLHRTKSCQQLSAINLLTTAVFGGLSCYRRYACSHIHTLTC